MADHLQESPDQSVAPSLKRRWAGSAILPGIPAGRQLGEGGSKVCGLLARVVIVSDSNAHPIPLGSRIPWGFSFPCPIPLHKFSFSHSLSLHSTPKGGNQRKREREKEERRQSQGYFAPAKSPETPFWANPSAATPPSPSSSLPIPPPSYMYPQKLPGTGSPNPHGAAEGMCAYAKEPGVEGCARARAFGYKRHRRLTRCVRAWAGRGLDEPERRWPLPCVLKQVCTCVCVSVCVCVCVCVCVYEVLRSGSSRRREKIGRWGSQIHSLRPAEQPPPGSG